MLAACLAGEAVAQPAPGVAGDRVLFGQTAALDGPAEALGRGMRLGIRAAFNEVNAAGGVAGRKLELLSYDDGYEPERAIANTRRLIGEDRVFALIGSVGTPTTLALSPVAKEARVPVIGPLTGATALRTPEQDHIVNVRAAYARETEVWIARLTEDLGIDRVAILYQDASFGRDGRDGVIVALAERGLDPVAEGAYRRNTTAVKRAVLAIRQSDPQAVAMVCAYAPCAAFIRTARAVGLDAIFIVLSFAGAQALADDLGAHGQGVVVSQVTPFPNAPDLPLARRYRRALAALDPSAEPGFLSFEGYLAGRVAIEGLRRAGDNPTREAFVNRILGGKPVELDSITLHFGPGDNQGLDEVWLSRIGGDGHVQALKLLSEVTD